MERFLERAGYSRMLRMLTIVALLVSSGAFAQPNSDKQEPKSPPRAQQGFEKQPFVGGAGIPPEARSSITKDIPMGDGKGKPTAPDAGSGRKPR